MLAGMPCPCSGFVCKISYLICATVWGLRWCNSAWLGCCVRLAGLVSQFVSHLALSFTLAGVLRPPRWACLRSCLPICLPPLYVGWGAVSASLGLSPNLSPSWLCLSRWLGCCVRLAGLVLQFVSHLALSLSLAGVLCPPRWACLRSCLPPACCVRLAGLVSQFVSHLALFFSLAGVLCPPRWACLPICLPSGFVFELGWGAVSASLGLSPVLSPNLSPTCLCLSPWLGCCVRLAGLVSPFVSQFVSRLALSFTLAGVLCPPRWACLPHLFLIWLCLSPWLGCCVRLAGLVRSCLPICLPPAFVLYVGWGAVSASLGLSPNLSPTWLCLSPWLGCCVRLAGLVS